MGENSKSAEPVDVLAVMDRIASDQYDPAEMVAAMKAVRELIEAADALLAATSKASTYWPVQDVKREAWNRVDRAIRTAVAADPHNGTTSDALRAALARCGGA